MPTSIHIRRNPLSRHNHRVRLFASLTGIDHTLVDVDLVNGMHRKEPFLKPNPFSRVPAIGHGDTVMADSNALLV